jgi:SAM-dependent methyltransferase
MTAQPAALGPGKADRGVSIAVEAFYEELPFNYSSAEHGAELIRSRDQIEAYPNVWRLLNGEQPLTVLDAGCGTGWFANTVALYHRLPVTGIDLAVLAFWRAPKRVQYWVQDFVTFRHQNLLDASQLGTFNLVNSLGVLHHTYDLREALSCVAGLVAEEGFLHLGLYHKYGREPFLDLFKRFRAHAKAGSLVEEEAFTLFCEMNRVISDEQFMRSWFRDQVLHPWETLHTLEEVTGLLAVHGFELRSTSINRFQEIRDLPALFEEEKKYYEYSIERNVRQKIYFPGFFTVLAQRQGSCKPQQRGRFSRFP